MTLIAGCVGGAISTDPEEGMRVESTERAYRTVRQLASMVVVFAAAWGAEAASQGIGMAPNAAEVAAVLVAALALWATLGFPVGNRQLEWEAIPRIADLPATFLYRRYYARRWERVRTEGRQRFTLSLMLRAVLPMVVVLVPATIMMIGRLTANTAILIGLVAALSVLSLGVILGGHEWRWHEARFTEASKSH